MPGNRSGHETEMARWAAAFAARPSSWLEGTPLSRRAFVQTCGWLAALMGMPTALAKVAEAVAVAPRPSVIWLHFQECTGCSESLLRAAHPSVERLILELISLDYHETLMAAAGHQAEAARRQAMHDHHGRYLLVVEGAVPTAGYCQIGGQEAGKMLEEAVAGAAAVIAVGSCAAFGGVPAAAPNPTGALPAGAFCGDKPLVNLPGCPPIPAVMVAVLAHYLTFSALPPLDELRRPLLFYGDTIHDHCPRRSFYDRGMFASSFDDAGARQGWCLFRLGCKGPVTRNACASHKWSEGLSFPVQSGHGCLGCSEPGFWDHGDLYAPLSTTTTLEAAPLLLAGAAGMAAGAALVTTLRQQRHGAEVRHRGVTLDDLNREEQP